MIEKIYFTWLSGRDGLIVLRQADNGYCHVYLYVSDNVCWYEIGHRFYITDCYTLSGYIGKIMETV